MTVKKTVRPVNLPGIHPGLAERIREAEQAELRGETPRDLGGPQKILRPSVMPTTQERIEQVETLGLVDPKILEGVDRLKVLAEQPAFMPGVDLDTVWDELSEAQKLRAGGVERFRLEMDTLLRDLAGTWRAPHEIAGRLDARNLERSEENLRAEIAAYGDLLAPDSLVLLSTFVRETRVLIGDCLKTKMVSGLDAPTLFAILRDWTHKLIYQELISRRRGMGDRGIRRVCANVELADQVYKKLKRIEGWSPRERLVARLIHVHQGLGLTAYAARASFRGTKMHRAYGARIFKDELNRHRELFTHEELETALLAVATHSSEELPFKESRVLALARAVDHLAPFAPHRVYRHLERVVGAQAILDAMLAALAEGTFNVMPQHKRDLRELLVKQGMATALGDDIVADFRAFERQADAQDLGSLAGGITALDYDLPEAPGALRVRLAPEPFAERYQILFDHQQDQLLRVARATGTKASAVRTQAQVLLQARGLGALVIDR